MLKPLTLAGIPFELTSSEKWDWTATPDGLEVVAKPKSDLFVDPVTGSEGAPEAAVNAVRLLGSPPDGDFVLSARVRVGFRSAFDAGVLMVWADGRRWAKLCFETSPSNQPMVVSVVTRGVSDDANAFDVHDEHVWLRVARVGRAFAFHASRDGATWAFVRAFALDEDAPIRIGFEAQSPTGEGCTVRFDDLRFAARTVADLRDGS
jgi:regulation of enolase protein 1 (concanavalin A-like superfamily)